MRSRIFFLGILTFWVAMNYLLWRSQYSENSRLGNAIPVAAVWRKILTAPDISSLDIYDHEEKIGVGHWSAGTSDSQQISGRILAPDYRPGDLDQKPSGYTLNFEGSVLPRAGTNRVRFQTALSLDTNEVWQDFVCRGNMRPTRWDVHAAATNQQVTVHVEDEDEKWDKTIKFSELENPQALLGDFGVPAGLTLPLLNKNLLSGIGASLHWTAREDRMKIGLTPMHAYKLETLVLGRRIEIYISRAGEILWVNLPNHLSLRNQVFGTYNP